MFTFARITFASARDESALVLIFCPVFSKSRNLQGKLQRTIEFLNAFTAQRAQLLNQPMPRNGQDVVKIHDAGPWKSLPAAQRNFAPESSLRSSHDPGHNGANRLYNGIARENNDRP